MLRLVIRLLSGGDVTGGASVISEETPVLWLVKQGNESGTAVEGSVKVVMESW